MSTPRARELYAKVRELSDQIAAAVAVIALEVTASSELVAIEGEVRDAAAAARVQAIVDAYGDPRIRNRIIVGWTGPLAASEPYNAAMRAGEFTRALELAATLPASFQVTAACWLGKRLVQAGRAGDAETVLRHALAVADRELDMRDPLRARVRRGLGDVCRGALRYAEAVQLYGESLLIHDDAAACVTLASYFLEGEYDEPNWKREVEPTLRRACALLEASPDPDREVWFDAWSRLARVLERTSPAEAARARKRAQMLGSKP